MKDWKEAYGRLDSGSTIGHVVQMKKLFSMGIRSDEFDYSRMMKVKVVGGGTVLTAGVVHIKYSYLGSDTQRKLEGDFHILEEVLDGYEVLLAPDSDSNASRDTETPASIGATIEIKGGVTKGELSPLPMRRVDCFFCNPQLCAGYPVRNRLLTVVMG